MSQSVRDVALDASSEGREHKPHKEDHSHQKMLTGMANLLMLQSRFREANDLMQLAMIAVNDTRLLFPYQQGYLWLAKPGQRAYRAKLMAGSDVPQVDTKTPFARWLKGVFRMLATTPQTTTLPFTEHLFNQHRSENSSEHRSDHEHSSEPAHESSLPSLPSSLNDQWHQFVPPQALWVPLFQQDQQGQQDQQENDKSHLMGGVMLFRDEAWTAAELRILTHWQHGLNHAFLALYSRPTLRRLAAWQQRRRVASWAVLIALGLFLMIPVQLSVLASARIIPIDPVVVRVPLNGTIDDVYVEPNDVVAKGDRLLSLEKSALQAQRESATQQQAIVEAELLQAQQRSFRDEKAKSMIPLLQLELERSRLEVAYVQSLLSRSDLHAAQSGHVLFERRSDLMGRPVQLGERVMEIATPTQARIELFLPVGDDIPLHAGDDVRLFLSVSPDQPLDAKLSTFSYEARPVDGLLTYRLTADFAFPPDPYPRIGQRGTARIHGDSVRMGYYLFRRPLAYLRQRVGW